MPDSIPAGNARSSLSGYGTHSPGPPSESPTAKSAVRTCFSSAARFFQKIGGREAAGVDLRPPPRCVVLRSNPRGAPLAAPALFRRSPRPASGRTARRAVFGCVDHQRFIAPQSFPMVLLLRCSPCSTQTARRISPGDTCKSCSMNRVEGASYFSPSSNHCRVGRTRHFRRSLLPPPGSHSPFLQPRGNLLHILQELPTSSANSSQSGCFSRQKA